MESVRGELQKLKSQVKFERCLRRKAESLSQVLVQELSEERARKEAMEKVCDELAEVVVKEREEAERVAEEVEEERKRMRVAEMMREEKVMTKMSNARVLMEEKLSEMEAFRELSLGMNVKGRNKSVSVRALYGVFDFSLEGGDPSSSSSCSYVL